MKRIVYLISPSKIKKNFYHELDRVLSFKNVKFFQLRLKNIKKKNLLKISYKIRKITTKHNVRFILNDNFFLVNEIKADGCHMDNDGSIKIARRELKNKILGITCHNSKKLVKNVLKKNRLYCARVIFKSKQT